VQVWNRGTMSYITPSRTTYIWHGHGPRARELITSMLKCLAVIVDCHRVGRGHAMASIDYKPRMRVLVAEDV